MANTRNDVAIAQGAWVDLYAGSGVSVGTACTVYNKGSNAFFVVIAASAPATPTTGAPKGIPVTTAGLVGSTFSVPASASGLWAYCELNGGSSALVQD